MVRICSFRRFLAVATTAVLLLLFCAAVQAQEVTRSVKPSDYDRSATSQATNLKHHARAANTPAGKTARSNEISNMHADSHASDEGGGAHAVTRYPADLEYHGGPVATTMESHLIYVNLDKSASCQSVATCWGNPLGFLRDLGQSNMIHIVDQYTGRHDDGRYTVAATSYQVDYPLSAKPYSDNDMLIIVHAVVTHFNPPTGYGNEYHVFLVPGQDECFNNPNGTISNVCYSPDNPATFFFCAYHGSADFNDIGHVLYSVEPFQNVPGCNVRPGTPNGFLADATNNVLSHETFETITDPDGTAWWNSADNGLFGQEIGDECSFLFGFPPTAFDPSNVTLNERNYAIQPEANNARHACTTAPSQGDE
jgi:hypothetical protein